MSSSLRVLVVCFLVPTCAVLACTGSDAASNAVLSAGSGGLEPALGGASARAGANAAGAPSAAETHSGGTAGTSVGGSVGSAGSAGTALPNSGAAGQGGSGGSAPATRYTSLVDPFIGTGGSKSINCFPGAVLPWGMVAVSPDTVPSTGTPATGSHASGYLSGDDLIQGFSHTRLQGTSTPDIGVVLLMPAVGEIPALLTDMGYRSAYDKASEVAAPGYYATKLSKPDVLAEVTATRRGAQHRYTFLSAPTGGQGRVVLDLGHAMLATSITAAELSVSGSILEGYTTPSGRFSSASKGGLKTYFSVQFDPAPSSVSTWSGTDASSTVLTRAGTKIGAVLSFAALAGTQVQARVGISYVDVAGARNNRLTELATLDFDGTRQRASDAWETQLEAVRFDGGTAEQRQIMATALYHSFVVPSLASDVDGRYHGFDNATHTAASEYFTNFSMWDTFRTVHPLLDLARRDQQRNLSRSLIQMAREGGYYPRWPMGHGYPNITAGSPADVVVGESYLRGVDGFDANEALDLMLKEVDTPPPAGSAHSGREGLADYLSQGYVPTETATPGVGQRVVVRTLEYNIADATIARMAALLGRSADAARASAWSKSYVTLWDANSAVFRGKHRDGTWWSPASGTFDAFNADEQLYYGANATQYSWMVPQDMAGLVRLHGSTPRFVNRLSAFFEGAASDFLQNQSTRFYTHTNEPDLHAAYLFLQAGRPDLTQKWASWAATNFYSTARDGIAGNEDAGALSAWYVLTALGLYPVSGTDIWLVGRPSFPHQEVSVQSGTLIIDAPEAGPTKPYVHGVSLRGRALAHPWVQHADLAAGGVLHFDMSDAPSTWGTDFGTP